MNDEGKFEEIAFENQELLKEGNFIEFPLNNMILIAGHRNTKMISFDSERCVLQETDFQFEV